MDTVKVYKKQLDQAVESMVLVYKLNPGSYTFSALRDIYLLQSPPDWIDSYFEYNPIKERKKPIL